MKLLLLYCGFFPNPSQTGDLPVYLGSQLALSPRSLQAEANLTQILLFAVTLIPLVFSAVFLV